MKGTNFHDMYKRQRDFQRMVYPEFDWATMSTEERIALTKDMVLHLQSEANEFMGEIAWKSKRRQSPQIVRGNLLDEAVDIIKMAMTLPIVWGFTADEVVQAFFDKSMVVEQRYKQEFPLYEIIKDAELLGYPSVVALDIDGVLANWPYCFYKFVERTHGHVLRWKSLSYNTPNPFDALANSPLLIRQWKDEYRQSGFKRELEVVRGAVEFTQSIKCMGFTVVLLTSRPYKQYSRSFADTMYWLDTNEFSYDAILWDDNKEARLAEEFSPSSVAMFVDDDEHNVDRVKASGFNAMLLDRPYNRDGASFSEIMEQLQNVR